MIGNRDKIDVTSVEIRDYALSLGWTLVKEALVDGLYLLNSPGNDYWQIKVPKDHQLGSYQEAAWISVEELAEYYRKSTVQVLTEIRSVNEDVLALRYYTDNKTINSISLQEALEAMEGTKQLLLSAASTIVSPSLFHPRLNRGEPLEMLKKAKLRHTQEGSFVIQIACPFDMGALQASSLTENEPAKPLARAALELVNQSSLSIIDAVDNSTIDALYALEQNSERPSISYNFCDALSQLYDEERELPFQLMFHWSPASKLKLPFPNLPQQINFPFSLREKLEEVKTYFAPQKRDISAMFSATVEALDGEFGPDERRAGAAILSLLYENEILKARVNLGADHHAIAIDAYRTPGAYIQLKGVLRRGKRISTLENISEFKLLV